MTDVQPGHECPEELVSAALDLMRADDAEGLAYVEQLLEQYPADAKLHFLRGSLLAAAKRYEEARAAMEKAVELAPLFAVARFQLGLLELSSGLAEAADATLAQLEQLGPQHALALLARGLRLLVRDDLDGARAAILAGMDKNTENPAINSDMRLLLAELDGKIRGADGFADEPITSTQVLLQQFAPKGSKH